MLLLKNDFLLSIKKRLIFCASSTHPGEEDQIAKTHLILKKKYKNLLTIIIPRHVERMEEIYNNLLSLDLKTIIRTSNKKINPNTDIYLVDTYGETENFFRFCKIVFLGGSLINRGGQNPLEPARQGCKILHGPNISNFREIYNLLDKYKISSKVNNQNKLYSNLRIILKKNVSSEKLINKLKKLGNKILFLSLIEIKKYLK